MDVPISAKRLPASLPPVVDRFREGTRSTVSHRSRPAFEIVPVNEAQQHLVSLDDDLLYHSEAVGASKDGLTAADHDADITNILVYVSADRGFSRFPEPRIENPI